MSAGGSAGSVGGGRGNWFWERLPARVSRRSLVLAAVLSDGDYVRAWPRAAFLAPVAAFAVGVGAAAILGQDEIYTYSIVAMAVLAGVSGLGSALGLWAWMGFVAADLVIHRPQSSTVLFHATSAADRLTDVYVPLAISYLLLAGLVVLSPVMATGLRLSVVKGRMAETQGGAVAGLGLQVVLQGAFAFFWAQATAFLIRPIWSFQGASPDVPGISPLQFDSEVLVGATVVGAAIRAALTLAAEGSQPQRAGAQPAAAPMPASRERSLPAALPVWLSLPLKAALTTLLLSGLIHGLADGVLVAVLVAVIFTVQDIIVPRLRGVADRLHRIPVLVRFAASIVIAYLLAAIIVAPLASQVSSFLPVTATVLLSLVVAAFLLPGAPPDSGEPRAHS